MAIQNTEKISDLNADRLVTHGILNYISATMQGQFAEWNTLSMLKSDKFTEDSLINAQRGLDKLAGWLSATIEGDCIFSARTNEIESFDSQSALELAKKVRDHITKSVDRLLAFSKMTAVPDTKELLEIVALAANSAYARDAYVRGFIEFGRRTNLLGMLQQYGPMLGESGYQVGIINDLIGRIQKDLAEKQSLGGDLPAALYAVTRNTIVMLRSQLHDLRQIIVRFEGEFDFAAAGFSREESVAWSERNLSAVTAGYWHAYEFTPDQALNWIDTGIIEPQVAATWRGLGFSVEETRRWAVQGINPFIGSRFKAAGYSPEETKQSLERGESIPVAKQQAA